jgi:hypothetical protein
MRLETLTSVEYEALDRDDSRDDYHVAFGVIRLGPAGERMWKGGDTEFCATVRAMGTLLLGVWGVPEVEILSSDRSCHHLLGRVIDDFLSEQRRHGWYSWFETSGYWEIVWGPKYRAVVEGANFTIYKYGKSVSTVLKRIEGSVEERKDSDENLRAAISYVEGYLRALTPKGLAEWKAFSGRGVRSSVLVKGD